MENKELLENLNSILGENNIPENLKDILKNLNTNNNSVDSKEEYKSESTDTSSNPSISPEMMQNLLNMFQSNTSSSKSSKDANSNSNIDIEMIMKMKTIMDKMNSNKEDPRASLLLSLKPYLKESRKSKIEQYVKLFNMTKVMEAFGPSGGDSK